MRDVFETLNHVAERLSPWEAERLGNAALELSGAFIAHSAASLDRGVPAPFEARLSSLSLQIGLFIDSHLGDPELSPVTLAGAHHISLRYLHRLFQAEGTTVCGVIRRRRLESSRSDLVDTDRPIYEIAARWGFRRPADFSRLFRVAYGMTPTEYRASARDIASQIDS